MKTKLILVLMAFALTAPLALMAGGNPADHGNPFLSALQAATPAELPLKSANIVKHAVQKNLEQTTIDVVKAAVGLNPAAATAIVASIAKSTPKMASLAAATAVRLVPDQAASIARAATAAAPKEVRKIVEAICRVVPASYQAVALAASEMVPGASREILEGIAAAVPSLSSAINQLLASQTGNNQPVMSTALDQISKQSDSPALTMAQPTFAPKVVVSGPTIPRSSTPSSPGGTLNNGDTPPGHRGYASP